MEEVFVLLKWSEIHGQTPADAVQVHSVHRDMASVEARLARIQRANREYELRPLGAAMWTIGPDEDQGFFGDRMVYLRLVRKDF